MSDDDYFGDDILDSSFLNAVDAIEAAHFAHPIAAASRPLASGSSFKVAPPSNPHPTVSPVLSSARRETEVIELHDSSSDYGLDDFPVDDAELARIDQACERELQEFQRKKGQHSTLLTAASSSANGLIRRPSKGAQMTLFGEVAQEHEQAKPGEPSKRTFERTRSTLRQMPLPGVAKKTKQWDRTAYAKSGWRKAKKTDKGKGKGKSRSWDSDDGDHDEEHVEFEQFPAPELPTGPAPAMKLRPDRLAAKTWIYPLNKPKRDYQYNIVKQCLLENTLVALPTGLGKTFIAGVVMLNFYNWFPQGKVVFVAPTKPLVAQQIDACHKTCGIPGSAAAELTGTVTKDRRINAWQTKRVFYATPQTLLNDLINGHVDSRDIVLIVIDEAHRGTGDYAYAQVVRYMMQHNPHFRILALTATPGGKPEAVQEIVDALHISHIEIRSESDPDLKKYLHTKFEQEHFVRMTEDIAVLRDGLAALITPLVKKVQSAGFLKNGNVMPTMLHPFRCQATLGEMSKAKAAQWAISAAAQLGPLARAMGYLMENSISMCYGYLKGILTGVDDSNSKKAIRKSEGFVNLMKKFEEQASRGFSMHPKMDVLRTLLIDNFAKEIPEGSDEPDAQRRQSRAMVFVSYRECVEEIVELLNKESPIIRAKPFIGQSTDKQGKKGYAQKEQLDVIEKFKSGMYNVLVSTSIGEEGLDIGEVDLIICYDAQKTPIRMLQRIGRTGRKASGTVHILLAQGREEHNWQKAQSNYAEVQHFIVRASDLEVYGDVARLVPDDIDPDCVEMQMEIEEYVREERLSRKTLDKLPGGKGKTRKRDDNPSRNMPAGASKGFVSVADLLTKGDAKRSKQLTEAEIARAAEDDSDDEEIEAGINGPRRTKSTSAAAPAKGKKKGLARSATTGGPSKKASGGAKGKGKRPAATKLHLRWSDDSDDEAIERGPFAPAKPSSTARKKASPTRPDSPIGFRPAKEVALRSSSPDIPSDHNVIDLTDSPKSSPRRSMHDSSPEPVLNVKSQSRRVKRVIESSPSPSPEPPLSASRSASLRGHSNKVSPSASPPEHPKNPSARRGSEEKETPGDDSMAWLIEDDDDLMIDIAKMPEEPQGDSREPLFLASSPVPTTSPLRLYSDDDEPVLVNEPMLVSPRRPKARTPSPPRRSDPPIKGNMGPPALPTRITNASPSYTDDLPPEPSFAIRAPGRHPRKRPAPEVVELESSPLAPPPLSQRRLQHDRPLSRSPSPASPERQRPRKKKRVFRDVADAQRHNPWMDVEATHSGDERSVGGSSDLDTELDSEDRAFLNEPGMTQVSPSYDQANVYRRSLMTQVPGGPTFANRPARRGPASFGPVRQGSGAGAGRFGRAGSSSPTHPDDEPDEYMIGSFVVDDEAEISFNNAPSSDY